MIIPDLTALYQLVIFLAAVFVLSRYLIRPVLGVFEARDRMTRGTRREAEALKEEADESAARYTAEIEKTWREAFQEKERILHEADVQAHAILDKAREEGQRTIEELRARMDTDVSATREALRAELSGLARQMSARLLGRALQVAVLVFLFTAPSWAAEAEPEGPGAFFSMNLVWSAVNFCLFVGILIYYARAPLADYLRERKGTVSRDIEEAAQAKKAEEERYALYSGKLAKIHEEAGRIHATLRAEGEAERKRLLEEADRMGQRFKEEAREVAEAEALKARRALREEVASLAAGLAEKVVADKFSGADQDRLVGEFLARLKGSSPRTS